MTPEQLDDLFRANDARADFRPQPGEWEQMDALLEEDERRGGAAQWVSAAWLLLFVGLIVGGIAGAVRFAPGGEGGDMRLSPKPAAAAFDHLRVAPPISTEDERPAARRQSNGAAAAFDHLQVAPPISTEDERPAARKQSNGAAAAFDHLQVAPPISTEEGRPAAWRQSNGAAAAAFDHFRVVPSIVTEEGRPSGESRSNRATTALQPSPLFEFWRKPTGLVIPPINPYNPERRSFALRVLLAAEANEVDMDGPLAFGALVGVGGQFRVARDWSVGVAALVGKKNYVAGPDQIHMPKDLFVDEVMPSKTSVNATILQFPINVTYAPQASDGLGSRWFATASLNSYQLLRDHLDFTYPSARAGQTASMTDAQPGGAFASSVQLGGGLAVKPQHLPHLYVGPYVELPLKRSGYSEVSLYTLGLQLQIGL